MAPPRPFTLLPLWLVPAAVTSWDDSPFFQATAGAVMAASSTSIVMEMRVMFFMTRSFL